MKQTLVVFVGALAVVALPIVATAHNAGHIFLPDGTCQNLGSGRDGPLVGKDRTQLDLIPGPGDQFGVSFVGRSGVGQTPIVAGACPAQLAVNATADLYNIMDSAVVSTQ